MSMTALSLEPVVLVMLCKMMLYASEPFQAFPSSILLILVKVEFSFICPKKAAHELEKLLKMFLSKV